jgi:hypothetical protein
MMETMPDSASPFLGAGILFADALGRAVVDGDEDRRLPSPAIMVVTGNLDPSYHDGRGLHLNSKGIRVWRTALTTILDPWRSF